MRDPAEADGPKRRRKPIARFDARSRQARAAIAVAAFAAYVLAFFLVHAFVGLLATTLAFVPVIVTAWLFGLRGGLAASLLVISLNMLLSRLSGEADWFAVFRAGGGPGTLFLILSGLAVGRLHDLSDRVKLQLAERERAEEALRDTTAALNSTLNLEEVLDRILTNVGRVVPHDAASVMLIEAGISYLIRRVGYTDPVAGLGVRSLRFQVADVPTLREMGESGQPLVIPDTRAYTGWVDRPETRWIRSYVGAPIRAKGQTIGFLNLNSATPGFFTAAHAERLLVFADQTAVAIDNARLYGAERRRVETLAALHETGLALSAQLDLPVLLQTIVERAARLLGSPMGELYLLLPDEQSLELKVGYNLPRELTGLRVRVGEGFSGRIAQTGEPLIVGNYHTWPGRLTALDHIPFGSVVGAPIKWQERVTGVILVDDFQPDRFEPADVQWLSFFADQAAVAIENARLYSAERRRAETFGALHATSLALSAQLDLSALLQTIVERAAQLLDASKAGLYLMRPGEEMLELVVNYKLPPEFTGVRLRLGEGVSGRVAQSGQPLIVGDYRAWPGRAAVYDEVPVAAVVGVPMKWQGQVVGVIVVDDLRPDRFDNADAEVLTLFADQAAIAVENARLFQVAQQTLAEQNALLTASTAVSSSLDLPTVLSRLAEHIGQAVDATSVYIGDWNPEAGTTTVLADYYGPEALPQEHVSDLGVTYDEFKDFGPAHDTEWLVTDRPALYHADDPITPAGRRAHMLQYGARSWLIVPLVIKGRVLGYTDIWESRRRREFTPQEIALCQAIASQAAIAIENARLYDAIRRHADELEQRVVERTAELDRERQRLTTILDAAGEGIALIDRNHAIVYVNAAMEQLTGYTLAEVLNRTIHLWSREHTPPAVNEALERCLEQGAPWRGEVISRRKDGTHYDAALTIIPLRGADGAVVGYVASQRDITHLKELERLRNQFVSRIGHELRTPLSNIRLYVELLERGKPEKRAEYMQTLWRETTRLQKLIEGFLEISQLDAGMLPVNPVPTDLNQLLDRVIGGYSALAAERGLTLTLHPDPSLPRALADLELVGQVMAHLLENALHYTPRGGRITVRTALRRREEREWVTLAVQDTGPGISPEEIPRLFGRFFRGEAARDFSTPGAGLGLAISKAIVDRLEGRITVDGGVEGEPSQRQGAAFTVWLRPAQ